MIFVYKTTNKINGKFYIGVHKTDRLDDGYLGSGKWLKHAIKKYGKENFEREILKKFDTIKEAYDYEKELVNPVLIEGGLCYNLNTGGHGGWYHIDTSGDKSAMKRPDVVAKVKEGLKKYIEKNKEEVTQRARENIKKAHQYNTGKKRPKEFGELISKKLTGYKHADTSKFGHPVGYKDSPEARASKSKAAKRRIENGFDMGSLTRGKVRTKEQKEKYSKARKKYLAENGISKLTCPHCHGIFMKTNAIRWHFDKCKYKKLNYEHKTD